MTDLINLHDFNTRARERLPKGVYDYFAAGAADDVTVRENETAWAGLRLRPRVGVDVSACELGTTILGHETAMPIMTAPCGLNVLAHPEAEIAVARAAAAARVIQVVSCGAEFPLEEIARVNAAPRWFQLYGMRDPGHTRDLVDRVAAAGYAALCLTVDAPIDGIREHNIRNRFQSPPPGHRWTNLEKYMRDPGWRPSGWHDPSLNWKSVEWVRGLSKMPVVLKGILTPEDARLAAEHGARAIVVSNHGGRQLDTSVSTCAALPAIAAAAGDRMEVYADGGIRRGSDVLKALAMGARAVLIGRPYLWGLAAGGEAGVRRVLDILREELRACMALAGGARIEDIGPSLIR